MDDGIRIAPNKAVHFVADLLRALPASYRLHGHADGSIVAVPVVRNRSRNGSDESDESNEETVDEPGR